ncbi:MAG TPA: phosphoribosylanthranilate isomerase, partial [Bacteroidia bacterium]|nr:phosphoribosylanthranilate isomerase [Bacteroidia bacterium]
MKIKVCGIADNEDLKSIAASGVDLVGFIFASSSPRYAAGKIDPATSEKISVEFPLVKKVGIFLNEK